MAVHTATLVAGGGSSSAPSGTDNRLQSDGTYTYYYDNEGNRIGRFNPADGTLTTFSYDYRDRLVTTISGTAVLDGAGNPTFNADGSLAITAVTQTVSDTYDVNNRRIGQTVDKVVPGSADQIEVDRYVFDGDNVVLDFVADSLSATPKLAHRYLWGDAVDQIFAQEDVDGSTSAGEDILWPLTDNQGSVRDIVKTIDETQRLAFSGVPTAGTWTITTTAGTTTDLAYNASLATIQTALDATTTNPDDIVISGSYADGFVLTYSGLIYASTNVSQATVDDSELTVEPTTSPEVVEEAAGVVANDEQWSFSFDEPVGTFIIRGNGKSVGGTADGSMDGSTLQGMLETLYGTGNVTVTLTSGNSTAGTYTVEFVEGLADTPITDPPSIQTSGLSQGNAAFTSIATGFAGVHEVQVITAPSSSYGGGWRISNTSGTLTSDLAYGADAAAVQSAVETVTGKTVTVTGSDGGPYTVTWTAPGSQSFLLIRRINFGATATTHDGDSSSNETQTISFGGAGSTGTWSITTLAGTTSALAGSASLSTIQAALNATTPYANDIVVTGNYSAGFVLTYSGTSYADTDVSQTTISSTLVSSAGVARITTSGVASRNEQWQFSVHDAYGTYEIDGNGTSVTATLDGGISGSTLQSELQSLYSSFGSGVVTVSPSGYQTNGTFTITFVGALAATPISDPPSISTSLSSGSASFTNIVTGHAAVNEVQTITLPDGIDRGTWSLDGTTLQWDADAAAVEAAIAEADTEDDVTVTGGNGVPYTVVWAVPGPQDLLEVANIDLKVPVHVTASTIQNGAAGIGLAAHIVYDSFGVITAATDGGGASILNQLGSVTNVLYDGYTYDAVTQTYVTVNRRYDPATGKWLSVDPIGFGDGPNPSAYVHNGPTDGTDPTGEDALPDGKFGPLTKEQTEKAESLKTFPTGLALIHKNGALENYYLGTNAYGTWIVRLNQAIRFVDTKIDILFKPNATCQCDEVRFTQAMMTVNTDGNGVEKQGIVRAGILSRDRSIDLGGRPTSLFPSFVDTVSAGLRPQYNRLEINWNKFNTGWAIDVVPGVHTPWTGYDDKDKIRQEHVDARAEWDKIYFPAASPWLAEKGVMHLFDDEGRFSGPGFAMFLDKTVLPGKNVDISFQAVAICTAGKDKNMVYGTVHWGIRIDSSGKETVKDPILNIGPNSEFTQAMEGWNLQKVPASVATLPTIRRYQWTPFDEQLIRSVEKTPKELVQMQILSTMSGQLYASRVRFQKSIH